MKRGEFGTPTSDGRTMILRFVLCSFPLSLLVLGQITGWTCSMVLAQPAKTNVPTLEDAVARYPQDETLRTNVTTLAGFVGRGANDTTKHALQPVPLPESIPFGQRIQGDEFGSYGKDIGAVYLHRHLAIDANPQSLPRRTSYDEILILSRRGAESFPRLSFSFNPTDERIFVNQLRVIDENGQFVYEADLDNFFYSDSGPGIASDRKLLNLPLSGLKPGCRIQAIVTIEGLRPSLEFPFRIRTFAASEPIHFGSLIVYRIPDDFAYWKSSQVRVHETSERIVFAVSQLDGLPDEPMQPPVIDFRPTIVVGTQRHTWTEVGDAYLDMVKERLGNHRTLQAVANEIVASAKAYSESEKIEALANYVRDRITYQALEFGRRSYVMEPTSLILKNRFGDCKDHSLLLHDLLLSQGIPARLVLVSTAEKVFADFPTLDQFDHMIVAVASSQGAYFIDATNKYAPPRESAVWNLGGLEALVLQPGKSQLVTIPKPEPKTLDFYAEQAIEIDTTQDILVRESLVLRNQMAHSFRAVLNTSEPGFEDRIFQSMMSQGEPRIQVQSVDYENLDRIDEPFRIHLTYFLPRALRTTDDGLAGYRPSIWEKYFFAIDYTKHRKTPFDWSEPLEFQSRTRLTADSKLKFSSLEIAHQESTPFFDWKVTSQHEEHVFEVITQARRYPRTHPPDQYLRCFNAMLDFHQTADVAFKIVGE